MREMKSAKLRYFRSPEGKGMIGCMLMTVVIAVAIYLGILLAPIYYANFNFESDVKTEVTRAGAHFIDDQVLTKNILDLARRNEIRITQENVSIERFAGQVHVTVEYSVPVDFVIFQRDLKFRVEESRFVGTL